MGVLFHEHAWSEIRTVVAGADVTDLRDRSNNIKKKEEEGEAESKIDT